MAPLGKQKKLSVLDLQHKTRKGSHITMVTAYDFPSALHVDLAGIDIILCGDSVAMVELGYPTTQPVDMDQMLHHCKAVARGAKRSLIVGDMPFGSYEVSEEQALTNAIRFVKEVRQGKVDVGWQGFGSSDSLEHVVSCRRGCGVQGPRCSCAY